MSFGATCVPRYSYAIQCFSEPLNDPDTCTFLIKFGAYENNQEKTRKKAAVLSFKNQVVVNPDETDTYASSSNDAVSNTNAIELQPTVTSLSVIVELYSKSKMWRRWLKMVLLLCLQCDSTVVGGTSTTSSSKSKVAKVTFGSDFISTQTSVTNVVLKNLDVSSPATLHQLPVVLPTTLQKLNLANTLFSVFPTLRTRITAICRQGHFCKSTCRSESATRLQSLPLFSFFSRR